MKVAIVCRDLRGLGGTTRTIVEHARAFSAKGWTTEVLAYRFDRSRLQEAGAAVRWVPGIPWGSWPKRRLFAAAADSMARGADVVHGHGDNLEQDVLSLHNCVHAAHEAVHGEPLPSSDAVGRLHARQLGERRFRVLICNSRLMAAEATRRFGVPAEMTRVLYPAHDPAQFSLADKSSLRQAGRLALGVSAEELTVGLITSGDFVKRGVGQFIDAVAVLKRRGVRFRAVIVGKEKVGPFLQQARGLEDVLSFHPAVRDVQKYYHALDLYCHPALYEEFGQSVQEAMACGLPVVTGPLVGASELFPAAMKDCIVSLQGGALADKLEALLADEPRRRTLGVLAREAVAANTWTANCEATAAILSQIR